MPEKDGFRLQHISMPKMGTLPIPLSEEETHCVVGCVVGAVLYWHCPSNYGLLECGKLII
jgi:hypothetical protein